MGIDLATAAGREALEGAISVVRTIDEADPVRRASKARSMLEQELATAAIAQVDLRQRARVKFGDLADLMFFTPDGLEQSSRREVADHRAARYAEAGLSSVLDLCCGIGADVMAFARAGLSVRGVDLDPDTAAIAAANCPGALIEAGRAEEAPWQSSDSVFLDPARRTDRGRTFDPSAYSPSFDFVTQVLTSARFAAAKLAPGIEHRLVPEGVEAEWVSFDGGVKEAVLWSSGFAVTTRRATLLPAKAQLTDADPSESAIRPVGGFVFEPDGAVIRAGLVQQAAALLSSGARIDEHLAYLTSDSPVDTPFASCFEVVEVLPYSVKRLGAELKKRKVGVVEIKKRGVDVDPAALRRELKPSGPNSLTVLLARVGEERLAILAHRLAWPPSALAGVSERVDAP